MKRWNRDMRDHVENPKVDAFLEEMAAVCRKHGLVLGHEDNHGAFTVDKIDMGDINWMLDAMDDTGPV